MADKVTLAKCPIGLFIADGAGLCLKTEYGNNEGRIDAYIVSSGELFWGAEPQTIASQRAQMVRPIGDLLAQAREMRTAIDMIEGALQRWPSLIDLPAMWGNPRHRRELGLRDITGNCGQLYDVYDALADCTRLINDPEITAIVEAPK